MNTTVAIKFRLYCTQTRMGEIVKVTGSGPELGNWNPANALTLHTSKEEFPIWRAGIFIDSERQPDPDVLEYKYIIVPYVPATFINQELADSPFDFPPAQMPQATHQVGPPATIWEHFDGNRSVELSQTGEIQVHDVFNEKKMIQLQLHTADKSIVNEMQLKKGASRDSKQFASKKFDYDLKFVVPKGIDKPEPGYETVSNPEGGSAHPNAKEKLFEQMVYKNFLQMQHADNVLNQSYSNTDRRNLLMLGNGGHPIEPPPRQMETKLQHAPQMQDQQSPPGARQITFSQIPRPNSDFLMSEQQRAMAAVQKETRKFVKMVRLVREVHEDHKNHQTPIDTKKGSMPYFLEDDGIREDHVDIDQANQSPQIHGQYVPGYDMHRNQAQIPAPHMNNDMNATIQKLANFQQPQAQMRAPQTYMPQQSPPQPPLNQQMGAPFQMQRTSQQSSLITPPNPTAGQQESFFQSLANLQKATPLIPQIQQNPAAITSFFQPNAKIAVQKNEPSAADPEYELSSDDELEKKLTDPDIRISKTDSLIIVSFRLPISIIRKADGQLVVKESRSMLYPTIFRLKEKGSFNFKWVGWPGIYPKDDQEREKIAYLLGTHRCYPIWFRQAEIERYLLFNEQFMRPLFHNFKGTDENEIDEANAALWHTYKDVNQKFVESLIQIIEASDMLWIHDIYLLLTPIILKKRNINNNLGFFLHSPFPSSDIYKTFQYRAELLKSLLCCDLVGFHIFEYARNFFTACSKILQLQTVTKKGGFMGIDYNGRTILLKVNHIGINQDDVGQMLRSQEFYDFKFQLTQQTQNKKVILASVDRLHPISGLKSKLMGYQRFLKENPPYRQNTCLIQYVLPADYLAAANQGSSQDAREENQCKNDHAKRSIRNCDKTKWTLELIQHTLDEINTLVKEIHEEFGFGCLIFREENLSQEQRCALWHFTNILINTSLRDGLCLQPMEFVSVKKRQERFEKSACIVSEFAGCARALGGAFTINPYDVDEIAERIRKAIDIQSQEKVQRMEQIFEYIQRHSTLKWAQKFLVDLKRAYEPVGYQYEQIGFGLNWQLIRSKQGFKEIEFNMMEEDYCNGKKRLIIIDQEGVIPMKTVNGAHEPTPEAVQALNQISDDKQNIVFVVSTESKSLMHTWYHQKAPRLGLAAENGFFWRWISQGKREDEWNQLIEVEDFQWINQVKLIMQGYKDKTEGSYIEQKESSIIWNYQSTDLEFGRMQAKELHTRLSILFENLPIDIIESKTSVQVVPKELKKEKLVRALVERESFSSGDKEQRECPIDMILYVGGDGQTEQVFKYLNRIQTKQQRLQRCQLQVKYAAPSKFDHTNALLQRLRNSIKAHVSPDISVFTCTIGRRATQAKYFLGEGQIVDLLAQFNRKKTNLNSRGGQTFGNLNKSRAQNYSIANFGMSNLKFGKLIESGDQSGQIVKTKLGGIFTRHTKKLPGNTLQNMLGKQNSELVPGGSAANQSSSQNVNSSMKAMNSQKNLTNQRSSFKNNGISQFRNKNQSLANLIQSSGSEGASLKGSIIYSQDENEDQKDDVRDPIDAIDAHSGMGYHYQMGMQLDDNEFDEIEGNNLGGY